MIDMIMNWLWRSPRLRFDDSRPRGITAWRENGGTGIWKVQVHIGKRLKLQAEHEDFQEALKLIDEQWGRRKAATIRRLERTEDNLHAVLHSAHTNKDMR